MTTWDLATIAEVEHLYVKVAVSLEVEARAWARGAIGSRLASAFCVEAHPLAVDIHPGDVAVRRGDEDPLHATVDYAGFWRPTTRTCQLLGGERDGAMCETRLGRWDTLRVARLTEPLILANSDAVAPTEPVSFAVDDYEVIGWSETGRHWVRSIARSRCSA